MNRLFGLLAATVAVAASAQAPFSAPESAVQDPSSLSIYVSNVAGTPLDKDGNGFISRVDAKGQVTDARFLPVAGDPVLNAPKGLAIARGTLWVTDIDRVVGYDLASRKQTRVIDLVPFGVKFANDLTVGPDGRLWLSDTFGDQVLALDVSKEKEAVELVLKGATGGANGLFFDSGGHLLVASSPIDFQTKAQVHRFHFTDGKPFRLPTQATQEGGIYDGIVQLGQRLLVSDWSRGSILSVDAKGKSKVVLNGLKGPADFALTADGKHLIVVDMGTHSVTLKPVARL